MSSHKVRVTGCSCGIGRLTAQTLAKAGHTVGASMRDIQAHNRQAADQTRAWANYQGVALRVGEVETSRESP
jgi:NAD(P)-dependent dehydrogenase (short-subunit alcohol dehydrogenase family)